MIDWKDPKKEAPLAGAHIWVLLRFPKTQDLLSCEIIGVQVHEKVNKEIYFVNDDGVSRGLIKWTPDQIDAWASKESINLPEKV